MKTRTELAHDYITAALAKDGGYKIADLVADAFALADAFLAACGPREQASPLLPESARSTCACQNLAPGRVIRVDNDLRCIQCGQHPCSAPAPVAPAAEGEAVRAWVTRDAAGPCEVHMEKPTPRIDEDGYTWPGASMRDLAAALLPAGLYGAEAIVEIEIRRVVKP